MANHNIKTNPELWNLKTRALFVAKPNSSVK